MSIEDEMLELCYQIEKLPASEQQTNVITLASGMLYKLRKEVVVKPSQPSDLSLVSDLEMLTELKKRYDVMVFIGKKKNVDLKQGEVTMDFYNGNFNECAGLALEASLKQTYSKLSTQRPAQDY